MAKKQKRVYWEHLAKINKEVRETILSTKEELLQRSKELDYKDSKYMSLVDAIANALDSFHNDIVEIGNNHSKFSGKVKFKRIAVYQTFINEYAELVNKMNGEMLKINVYEQRLSVNIIIANNEYKPIKSVFAEAQEYIEFMDENEHHMVILKVLPRFCGTVLTALQTAGYDVQVKVPNRILIVQEKVGEREIMVKDEETFRDMDLDYCGAYIVEQGDEPAKRYWYDGEKRIELKPDDASALLLQSQAIAYIASTRHAEQLDNVSMKDLLEEAEAIDVVALKDLNKAVEDGKTRIMESMAEDQDVDEENSAGEEDGVLVDESSVEEEVTNDHGSNT